MLDGKYNAIDIVHYIVISKANHFETLRFYETPGIDLNIAIIKYK